MLTREICKCCDRENPLGFTVPDDIWVRAVGPFWVKKALCIICFDALATQNGVDWADRIEFWPVSGMQARREKSA